ncbi:MAG: ribosome maturation factor RimP [Clostridiales bacterium]|nr:ribosome maturation factor RimP [Clostridiales bacterium]
MASKVVDRCNQHIVPIIENLGYDVLEVEYAKKVDGMNLTFYIDKQPEGISLDDCERVNNAITDVLDEINVTDDAQYILNVSSAGLDRPIKNQKDFLRNKNKQVEVKLYTAINKQKVFVGELIAFDDNGYTIKTSTGEELFFEKEKVAICLPVIEF